MASTNGNDRVTNKQLYDELGKLRVQGIGALLVVSGLNQYLAASSSPVPTRTEALLHVAARAVTELGIPSL